MLVMMMLLLSKSIIRLKTLLSGASIVGAANALVCVSKNMMNDLFDI